MILLSLPNFDLANFHCAYNYLIDCRNNLPSDYLVLSEFTLALFEDSGWYKANYTALYDLQQNPLQWGKGMLIFTSSFSNLKCLIQLLQAWDVISLLNNATATIYFHICVTQVWHN